MRLSKAEQETVITIARTDDYCEAYTNDIIYIKSLDKLMSEYPEQYSLVSETSMGKTYRCPKKLIKFSAPRKYTTEQKKEAGKRLAKGRAKKQQLKLI